MRRTQLYRGGGDFRGPLFTSVAVSFVCVFLLCAVSNATAAAATTSPLTLTSSTASPVALSAYRPDAATAVVAFNNSGGASAVSWFVTASVPWLSFTTANTGNALAPAGIASVTVSAAAAGLAKGDHSTTLVVGVAGGEELVVPLVFTVSSPLEVSPATVTESCALGTTAAATLLTVTNRAVAAVAWTSVASATWIVASPTSGASLAGGASVTVSLTLGAGLGTQSTHRGSFALAEDGVESEVSVSVELATRLVSGGSKV